MIHLLFHKSIVPLKSNALSQFLPWVVGFMITLSLFTVSTSFIIKNSIDSWATSIQESSTLQILYDNKISDAQREKNITEVLEILEKIPTIKAPKRLSQDKVLSLLTPWLGEGVKLANLPIPSVIEFSVINSDVRAHDAIRKNLKQKKIKYTLGTAQSWKDKIQSFSSTITIVLYIISSAIFFFTMIIITASTRALMLMNTKTLYMMALMGATDSFISKDFCTHAFHISLKSSTIAYIINGLILLGGWMVTGHDLFILRKDQWLLLTFYIFITAVIGYFVASATVRKALRFSMEKQVSSV